MTLVFVMAGRLNVNTEDLWTQVSVKASAPALRDMLAEHVKFVSKDSAAIHVIRASFTASPLRTQWSEPFCPTFAAT